MTRNVDIGYGPSASKEFVIMKALSLILLSSQSAKSHFQYICLNLSICQVRKSMGNMLNSFSKIIM